MQKDDTKRREKNIFSVEIFILSATCFSFLPFLTCLIPGLACRENNKAGNHAKGSAINFLADTKHLNNFLIEFETHFCPVFYHSKLFCQTCFNIALTLYQTTIFQTGPN